MKPWIRTVLYFAAAVLITALLSVGATVTIMNTQTGDRVLLDSAKFQAYNSLSPLLELMETIKKQHYGDPVTDAQLLEGALDGALGSIKDPYARYYTEEEYVAYLEQLDGAYHGIGALVGQPDEKGAPVLKVYGKSPAQAAGLKAGDIITAVDGTELPGLTLEEIETLFNGDDGTQVAVTILRGTQVQTLQITRGAGVTQRVTYKLFLQRTGYINIDKFTGTAAEEFSEALRDLTDRGMRSLVIDLRNNPGGELEQVVDVADAILGEGVVVTVRHADGEEEIYRSDAKGISVPLAILVNENSASASEILAAAVQDHGSGIVVGNKTYGKGVVQTTMQLKSNQGWIKLTTAAYYTPNGKSVDGVGVQPDIDIDLADDVRHLPIDQIDQDDDAQLWAALDEVRAQADEREAA